MAATKLKFGAISLPDSWEVASECLDFATAGDTCLDQMFISNVEFTVDGQDISPSMAVPLLLFVRELFEGIEQANKYSRGGRGCVLTPVCEYELAFRDDQLHIYWFTWDSASQLDSSAFRGEFVVDERDSMKVFESFTSRVFDRLKSDYEGLAVNLAFGALEERAQKVFTAGS